MFGGAASSNVTIEMGLNGPSLAFGDSCAAGLIALGEAARLIADGRVPMMLAGGAEAPLAPLTFGAFAMIRVLSTRNDDPATASRPFDTDRDGFVIAEGGCVMVLESFEHAKARGAHIYAELRGYATTSDAHHMTAPRPDGVQAARSMSDAIKSAELEPGRYRLHQCPWFVDGAQRFHGVQSDPDRAGDHADQVAVSGTKGLHAHALGATGAMEAAICALALTYHLPGTANLERKDPACDLDVIAAGGRDRQVRNVLCNAFGFGGVNATLVLSQTG